MNSAPQPSILSRREFLTSAVAIGSGLSLSFALPAQAGAPPRQTDSAAPPRNPSGFLQIATDNTITIVAPAVEMGQGGHTSMAMILMEELDGDPRYMIVKDAPAERLYRNPVFGQQSTVGSFAIRGWYAELRRIGAAAREMLVAAAAQEWSVPASECAVANSIITHRSTGRTRTFGNVATRAASMPVPAEPSLKNPRDFTLIGSSPPRTDVPPKTDGSARFGIDVVLPDMLVGAVKTAPQLTGTLKSVDDSAARGMKGYHSTVRLPNGVIVLANNYWQAKSALERVKVDFEPGKLAGIDSARVSELLKEGFSEHGAVVRNDGDVDSALASAARIIEADYEVPYLAHACMEPMNCTARVNAGGCEVWCGTQIPQAAQAAAAAVLSIPPERVAVHSMYLGGGFGRRGETDYVTQAVTAAKAAGRPVKLVWSREEDIQHDYYRPTAAIRFRAGLDASNKLIALEARVVTSSVPADTSAAPSLTGQAATAAFYTGGVGNMVYDIPNLRVTGIDKDIGLRFGFSRAVNQSHNPYMLESFLDEVAVATKQDPYRFRRSMLQHDRARRQLALLDMLAEKSGWESKPADHYYGISAFASHGSFVGAVVDLSRNGDALVLNRVVMGIDCGVAVYPDNIEAQLESGMVYGLTAALHGEITLRDGAVEQSNFHDYRMLFMSEMPRTESHIVPSTEAPGGVGETGTGPIAPSLVNAIFAATGQRLRSLPVAKQDIRISAGRA